ncbi:molybdate ABC transporter substrate-binding protein [Brachybacterium sp. p3-SID957]|uniref:molybdate ABC transporter substrate-binding protein n=1 Tax=Brachybacterium sp. p3-SID957 TaxID=2916049 RepID=UPI0021E47C17|nr:molybdate ABC transporter substrate-binding protein [Brachybacterium sp. p3-SID957]MCT1775630.1 molybdate ABC transporter substrate-binding protein [Brachybacterium sp. p3-SID957]
MRRRPFLAALLPVLLLASCGPASTTGSSGTGGATTELTVFAAASLRVVFDEVGTKFEEANPQVTVRFNYAGSADLITQLDAGAPADVLVTANQSTMDRAVDAGTITAAPAVIASNVPVLVTPADNAAGLTDLESAVAPGVDLVVCAPQVPCGAAAQTLAENADIDLTPVSEESSVTDVLGKVTTGQADAGIVYATDAADAGEAVTTIDLPGADQARTEYPAAVTASTEQPEQAQAFVDFLRQDPAQALLADAGFQQP